MLAGTGSSHSVILFGQAAKKMDGFYTKRWRNSPAGRVNAMKDAIKWIKVQRSKFWESIIGFGVLTLWQTDADNVFVYVLSSS